MKPRRRRIKVYATGAHRGALEQPRKCKNKPLFFASAASSISNEPLSPLSLPSLKKKGFRHGLLGEMVDGPGCFSFRRLRLISLIQIFLVKNWKCKAVYVTFARFRECLRLLSEPSLIWESGGCQMTRLLLTWVFGTALRFWLE